MRFELTIRKHADPSETGSVQSPRRFPQLKSVLIAFLLLSTGIGVLIAAFVLGSVVAIVLIGIVILALIGMLVRFPFRRLKKTHKKIPYEDR